MKSGEIPLRKSFFFVSFLASLFCTVAWVGMIIFMIATGRLWKMGIRGVVFCAALLFFVWAASVMFRAFKSLT